MAEERRPRMPVAYLAGPDVFFPGAAAHAARKAAICAGHGIDGRAPLNDGVPAAALMPANRAWRAIFHKDLEMMREADLVIANLTPFMGASADAGTLVEVGWFLGRGRPVFGYTNEALPLAERVRLGWGGPRALPWAGPGAPGPAFEDFGLPDNLMVAGAVVYGGGLAVFGPESRWGAGGPRDDPGPAGALPHDHLGAFERCVAAAALAMGAGRIS